MISDATRSLETAASGAMPKTSTRIGVISAPPPIPVRPTAKPTIRPANATKRSMCTPRRLLNSPAAFDALALLCGTASPAVKLHHRARCDCDVLCAVASARSGLPWQRRPNADEGRKVRQRPSHSRRPFASLPSRLPALADHPKAAGAPIDGNVEACTQPIAVEEGHHEITPARRFRHVDLEPEVEVPQGK